MRRQCHRGGRTDDHLPAVGIPRNLRIANTIMSLVGLMPSTNGPFCQVFHVRSSGCAVRIWPRSRSSS